MASGFNIYGSDDDLLFSSEDSTWTILFTGLAPAGVNKTWSNIPYMPTRVVSTQMLSQAGADDESVCHRYIQSSLDNYNELFAFVPAGTTGSVDTFFIVYGK